MAKEGDSPSWFKWTEGVIGPPVAHTAGWVGVFSCAVLAYVLQSLGYFSRNVAVVLIAAGFCNPFAITREIVARRKRNFETSLSDDKHQ